MKCSICNNEIEIKGTWKSGNNAYPINDGRCCDKCNSEKVIPARFIEVFNFEESKKRKKANEQIKKLGLIIDDLKR
jgi:hypothetical protein